MASFSERLNNMALAVCAAEAHLDNAPKFQDIASEMAHLANEIEEIERYGDLQDTEGEFPTMRQGLALARFLQQAMRDDQFESKPSYAYATVSRANIGVGGVGPNYLGVRFADGYEGGIDREGRVST